MLELKNIYKTFNPGTINEKVALNGLNLTLNEGDFVTVIGGNGAGKSTMLNAVAGTWMVDEGQIIIDGIDVTKLSEHKRAAYLGRVFQDPMTGTAATMGIEENLSKLFVKQTMLGAYHLINNSEKSLEELIKDVASKGGTTEAALKSFHEDDLKNTLKKGILAAENRAKELNY